MAGSVWKPEEVERLITLYKEAVASGVTQFKAIGQQIESAKALPGRNAGAVRMKLSALKRDGGLPEIDPGTALEAEFSQARVEQQYKDEIRRLRAMLREATRRATRNEDLIDAFEGLVPALSPPPFIPAPTAATAPDTAVETLMLSLGDWHFGEIVQAEATRGWNSYDADIASRRIRQVVTNVLKIKARLEKGDAYSFPELVVPIGGDMGTGMVHGGEDIERLGEWNIMRSSLACAWVLAQVLRDLAAHFPEVHAICIVGNHGRLGRRKSYKEPDRSFDWLIYQIVSQALRDIPNIHVFAPISHSAMFEVRGHRFYMTHGDEFTAHFSMPYYSIQRKMGQMLALEYTRNMGFKYGLIYHWHDAAKVPLPGGKNRIMPSLKGGDEYVLEKLGVATEPGQFLCGIHSKYGITHEWEIRAEPVEPNIEPYDYTPWFGSTAPDAEAGVPTIYRVEDNKLG